MDKKKVRVAGLAATGVAAAVMPSFAFAATNLSGTLSGISDVLVNGGNVASFWMSVILAAVAIVVMFILAIKAIKEFLGKKYKDGVMWLIAAFVCLLVAVIFGYGVIQKWAVSLGTSSQSNGDVLGDLNTGLEGATNHDVYGNDASTKNLNDQFKS